MFRRVVTLLLVAIRSLVAVSCVTTGHAVFVAFALVELLAALFGLANVFAAKEHDARPIGLLVPAVYVSGVFLRVEGAAGELAGFASVMAWLAVAWLLICRLHLREGWSVGCASWTRLCDWGVYAVVRHPGVIGLVMIRVAWWLAVPSTWNLGVVLATVGLYGVVTVVEESYLMRQLEYRRYRDRVRWWFVPGVV